MPIFVINLVRSPDRLRRMESILSGMSLSFDRIEAVDGKQFTPEARQALCAPKSDGMPWTAQEVGVALSHRLCWEKAAASPEKCSIIFEDDLFFSGDAALSLADTSWLPADFDLVKLETVRSTVVTDRSSRTIHGRKLARLHSPHLGAGAYIISREFAKQLLNRPETLSDQSDVVLFNKPHNNKIYQLIPAICIQDYVLNGHHQNSGLASTLEDERIRLRKQLKPHGLTKLRHELRRPVRQLVGQGVMVIRFLRGRTTGKIEFKK